MQCAAVTLIDSTVDNRCAHYPKENQQFHLVVRVTSLTLASNTQAMANQEAKYIPGTIHLSLLEVSSENRPTYESYRVKRSMQVHTPIAYIYVKLQL